MAEMVGDGAIPQQAGGSTPGMLAGAGEVARGSEGGREGHKPLARIDDLPLFAERLASAKTHPPRGSAVEDALRAADPDSLTPKGALELIYALRRLLAEEEK